MQLYGVQYTEVPNLGVTLFGGYSYDGLNAAIGVQHTEVPNLGASWSRFLARACEGTFLLVLYNCR